MPDNPPAGAASVNGTAQAKALTVRSSELDMASSYTPTAEPWAMA